METLGTHKLKTNLSAVLSSVEAGESVTVTRHGRPIARIVPPAASRSRRRSGAVERLLKFRRIPMPKGCSIVEMVREGRR